MNAQFDPLQVLHQTIQSDVTFVPHFSARAQNGNDNSEPWMACSEAQVDAPREAHASLAEHHRSFVLDWIDGLWHNLGLNDTIFEPSTSIALGWDAPHIRTVPNVTLVEQGRVYIGNSDDPFSAQTSSCEGQVKVSNQGALLIGGPDGSQGELDVVPGSEIIATGQGEIVVYPGSKLNVQAGAHLHLSNAKLHILPGGHVRCHPSSSILLSDGALVTLAPQAKLELQGDVSIPQGADVSIHSSGTISWTSDSDLEMSPLSTLAFEQSITGTCEVRGDVGWSGSGMFKIHGGRFLLSHGGNLTTRTKLDIESTNVATTTGTACLRTFDGVTVNHASIENVSWIHDGSATSQKSHVRLINSQWSNSDGSLLQAKVLMVGNHFDESHILISRAAPFSRVVGNEWNAPWNDDEPSLHLTETQHKTMLRENHWRGGIGFHATNSSFRALCNVWELCSKATVLEGANADCFSTTCGGGGNSWSSNDVHFELNEASLPMLSHSNNQFGQASHWIAHGITTSGASDWIVHGANWQGSVPSTATSTMSILNTQVQRWTGNGYTNVPWHAGENVEWLSCADFRLRKPAKKKSLSAGQTNILGQELPQPLSFPVGSNPLFKEDE